LTAQITAADVQNVGSALVTVFNPAPGGGTSNSLTFTINAQPNPLPTVSNLLPSSAPAGSPAFTLTVNGTNFVAGSVVQWNGGARSTVFNNSGQLTAQITAADVQDTGSANVTVFNPAPGGGTSNSVTFTISVQPNPVPTVSNLSQTFATAGSAGFTLTVNGTNFVPSSVVQWNGLSRTTTFINSGQLNASIGAGDLANPGTASVNVFTPTPGGGSSNSVDFVIGTSTALPVITQLDPSTALAGGPQFPLRVIGANFTSSSTVRWNGQSRTTTFDNSGQLTAIIPASDIAHGGTASVTVTNPGVDGGTSNTATFSISGPNAVPSLVSLNPGSIAAGSPAFTLTVTGSDFVSGAIVQINGSNRPTTFVNATTLTAQILASDVAVSGSAAVRVLNPEPGGGFSNELILNIAPGNPVPSVSSLSPNTVLSGSGAFTLTVNGSNFVNGAVVQWNGSPRATTFGSSGGCSIAPAFLSPRTMMLTAPPLIRNTNSDPPAMTTPSAATQARSTTGFERSDEAIVVARSRHSSESNAPGSAPTPSSGTAAPSMDDLTTAMTTMGEARGLQDDAARSRGSIGSSRGCLVSQLDITLIIVRHFLRLLD